MLVRPPPSLEFGVPVHQLKKATLGQVHAFCFLHGISACHLPVAHYKGAAVEQKLLTLPCETGDCSFPSPTEDKEPSALGLF